MQEIVKANNRKLKAVHFTVLQRSILKGTSVRRNYSFNLYPETGYKKMRSKMQINYCSLLDGLTKPNLASRLNVACGTARRRALSINLPVTRQMP